MTIFRSCGAADDHNSNFNALRTQVTALHDAIDSLLAKLDSDSGVNDTDYASGLAPAADTSEDFTKV